MKTGVIFFIKYLSLKYRTMIQIQFHVLILHLPSFRCFWSSEFRIKSFGIPG